MTRVVNLYDESYDVYIGRAGHDHDGYFGNPFAHGSRGENILAFEVYFRNRIASDQEFRTRVLALRGKTLGCFCKPDACHGDVIAAWFDEQELRPTGALKKVMADVKRQTGAWPNDIRVPLGLPAPSPTHETLSDYVGELIPTTSLGPLAYTLPISLEEMFSQGGSGAGFSNTSTFLSCPEQLRLKRLGVVQSGFSQLWLDDLPAWAFGVLMHALLARRGVANDALSFLEPGNPGFELTESDRQEAISLLSIYDDYYPKANEPFELLAVEKDVVTDLGGVQITVRYDKIVKGVRGVQSLEHKTSGRGGEKLWESYVPKSAWQVAAWNANQALVNAHGPMVSVLMDTIVRTKLPRLERFEHFIPEEQQKRVLVYARNARRVQFPIGEIDDLVGTQIPGPPAFRNKSACYGMYNSRCTYFDLCHYGDVSLYTVKECV